MRVLFRMSNRCRQFCSSGAARVHRAMIFAVSWQIPHRCGRYLPKGRAPQRGDTMQPSMTAAAIAWFSTAAGNVRGLRALICGNYLFKALPAWVHHKNSPAIILGIPQRPSQQIEHIGAPVRGIRNDIELVRIDDVVHNLEGDNTD